MSELIRDGRSPFDNLAVEYDDWYEGAGKLTFAIEVKAFEKVLSVLPKPWLEVGVGSGRFARTLGIEVGIDPCAELLYMAKERGIIVFEARGENQTCFGPKTFGTVFLIVTLCFVDSPLAVFKEAHRVLKPEGKLVLGVMLRESPWGKFYQEKKQAGHRFYKHATFYSYRELGKLLDDSGFVIEQTLSTLCQRPGEVREMEEPEVGYRPEAGFTIIVARKR